MYIYLHNDANIDDNKRSGIGPIKLWKIRSGSNKS